MSADTAIFLQVALENANLLKQEKGFHSNHSSDNADWRIFSKLGAGYSTSRERGEIVTSAYACIPPTSTGGVYGNGHNGLQISITCRSSVSRDVTLVKAQEVVKSSVDEAIAFVSKELLNQAGT